MAVSCQTFSLGHVLMGYAFGAAIRNAYGDRDGGNEDSRNGAHTSEGFQWSTLHKRATLFVVVHFLAS